MRSFGVRQFIAAFNDGIYSVPPKCREINFTKQGANKLAHSKERCHARKSKIHSNIFELTFSVFSTNSFPVATDSSLYSTSTDIVFRGPCGKRHISFWRKPCVPRQARQTERRLDFRMFVESFSSGLWPEIFLPLNPRFKMARKDSRQLCGIILRTSSLPAAGKQLKTGCFRI